MGNGVKALLVALLVISVVVGAQFVQRDSEPAKENPADAASAKSADKKTDPKKKSEKDSPQAKGDSRTSRITSSQRRESPRRSRITSSRTTPPAASSDASGRSGPTVASSRRPESPSAAATRTATGSTTLAPTTTRPSTGSDRSTAPRRAPRTTSTADSKDMDGSDSPAASSDEEGDDDTVSVVATPRPIPPEKSSGFVPQEPPRRTNANVVRATSPSRSPDSAEFRPTRSTLEEMIESTSPSARAPTTTASTRPGGPFNRPIAGSTTADGPTTGSSGSDAFPKVHEVGSGDSYWKLAEKYYGVGKGKHYKVIQKANNFAKLIPGKQVQIPAPPESASSKAASPRTASTTSPPRPESTSTESSSGPAATTSKDGRYHLHTVRRGDTLMDLAKKYYGNPRNFAPILDANRFLRYESLKVNQKIRIPVKSR